MSIIESDKKRRLLTRSKISAVAALAVASSVVTVVGSQEAFPHIPYETNPYDLRDSTLWRLFRGPFGGVMRLCGAEDKDSNYWQWQKTEVPNFRPSALLKGNYDTFVRNDTFDNIRMSCDGIHEVYLLKPPPEVTWRLIFQTVHQTQAGNLKPYEPKGNLFTGKLTGPIKFMRGNGDVLIYAVDENGKRIPLSAIGPFPRENPAIPGRLI